jgi:two-component system nitrogen regulation response regulator NtrX
MALDILIVDDEEDIRSLVADILKDEGFLPRVAKDSDSALKAIAERVPSLLLLDVWLTGSELDGLGILEFVKARHPELPVIMISGHGTVNDAMRAAKIGAFDFIEKPFDASRLLHVMQLALENAKLKRENRELKLRGLPEYDLTGQSLAIQAVRQSVEKVAPTHSRVLITGAPGTGKEVVARMVHAKSARADRPFVVVNAARLSADRVEAELFGIEDSGPAGGTQAIGLFEQAHTGTLFLDEVADMPYEAQGRILRALQEQAFERVRGNKKVTIDVRVIASTSKDLSIEIEAGRFREDLYYRLNVVPIRMPALRDRREDIPDLCQYFLKRASDLSGLPVRDLTDEALAVLQSYNWPGNVRQLRNMMEWVLIMAPGSRTMPIRSNMLPSELFESSPFMMRPDVNADIMSMCLRDARELFEKQYLAAQIKRFGGNISKTSNFVGMERSALHRKLKMLGITSDEKEAV